MANSIETYFACNIPTFPLVTRRFSQPGFGRSGGVGNGIERKRNLIFIIYIYNLLRKLTTIKNTKKRNKTECMCECEYKITNGVPV